MESDIIEVEGRKTPEGIHLGAMEGTMDYLQRGVTGIEKGDNVVWIDPCLPEQGTLILQSRWESME